MNDFVSVADAAKLLELNPSRVRALAASGDLEATLVGGSWVLPKRAVLGRKKAAFRSGRPYSPSNAWAALFLASGLDPDWISPQTKSRLRKTLRLEGLEAISGLLRKRGDLVRMRSHPGELRHIATDARVLLTGPSAAAKHGLDLLSGSEIEAYVNSQDFDELVDGHALKPASELAGDSNVAFKVVPASAWHMTESTPVAAVALDLFEAPDTRSQKAGRHLLKNLAAN